MTYIYYITLVPLRTTKVDESWTFSSLGPINLFLRSSCMLHLYLWSFADWGTSACSVCTWSKVDKKAFQQDLLSSELFSKDADLSELTVENLFSKYDSTLRCLLDEHLPVRKVRKRIEPLTPWFDSDCIKAKRNKRRLERPRLSSYWTCCWQSTVD